MIYNTVMITITVKPVSALNVVSRLVQFPAIERNRREHKSVNPLN
jgi:hypothetical protein